MEDIVYREWMEWGDHLDLVSNSRANSWLPAYGYHATQTQDSIHSQGENLLSDLLVLNTLTPGDLDESLLRRAGGMLCVIIKNLDFRLSWQFEPDVVSNTGLYVSPTKMPIAGTSAKRLEETKNHTRSMTEDKMNGSLSGQQSLFLETIIEETSDDLCSESDKSGPTGWNSDSDADSVIHLPKIQGNIPEIRNDWRTADFEAELPRKHKRRLQDRLAVSDDEEIHEVSESTMSSRSSSLIAFESLEKHCEDVFKTSASNDPFGPAINPDPLKWKFSSRGYEDVQRGISTDDDSSSSSSETLHRSQSSHGSFRSSLTNDSRLRSYRSFDSLNLLESPSPVRYLTCELSQSQSALDVEKEKEIQQEFVVRDKKLTATTADLSIVADSYDTGYLTGKGIGLSFRRRQELASFHYKEVKNVLSTSNKNKSEEIKCTLRGRKSYSADGLKLQLPVVQEDAAEITDRKYGKSEPCLSNPSKSQQSVENLSEDSGFGDHISVKNKTGLTGLRSSVSSMLEDEDSSPLESSSYYSDCTGSEESSIVSTEGREHSKTISKNGSGLKIAHAKESEMRGYPTTKDDDADVKYNTNRSQIQQYNCAADCVGMVKLQGKTGELITSVAFASHGSIDTRSGDAAVRSRSDSSAGSRFSDPLSFEDCKRISHFGGELNTFDNRKDFFFESCDEMNSKTNFEDRRQLTLRLPVASTPNLCTNDEDYVFSGPLVASSLSHVPLKSLDDDSDDLRNQYFHLRKGQLSSSQNAKGVHFCPIVSEVSWREVYSEEDSSSNSSDASTDEMSNRSLEELFMKNVDGELFAEEEKCVSTLNTLTDSSETPGVEVSVPNRMLDCIESEEMKDGHFESVLKGPSTLGSGTSKNTNNSFKGNEVYTEKKPVPPSRNVTPTASDQMHTSNVTLLDSENITKVSVSEVYLPKEVCVNESLPSTEFPPRMALRKKTGKSRFGGFLERFSFRRISSRKTSGSVLKKQKEKEKEVVLEKADNNGKEEIKIIPLRAPGEEEALRMVLTPPAASAKPPLPPCPPRSAITSRRRPNLCGGPSNESRDVARSNMPGVGEIDSSDVTDIKSGGNEKPNLSKHEKPVTGLLETDLDTQITVQSAVRRPLTQTNVGNNKKARSLMNLGLGDISVHQTYNQDQKANLLQPTSHHRTHHGSVAVDDRAKSMEFLLDKENQAAILPPENELQKSGTDRVMSEHQLRVQRSLQKLNIPDWYKNSAVAQTPQGFLLKRHGDSNREHQGWPGLGSKTTSLSSLGSSKSASARSPTSHVLSPSPTPHLLSRWSTSRLYSGGTSTSTSPCGSARSSFNYRQPYLGWRSQERLTRPRTPAERLAAGLLPQQKQLRTVHNDQVTPNLSEVRTSIKEVTSAIVHYVSGDQESSKEATRNYSPNPSPTWQRSPKGSVGKLCWLESSFVGSRPLDQPETPLALEETPSVKNDNRSNHLFLDLKPQTQNNSHMNLQQIREYDSNEREEPRFEKAFDFRTKPSPGSTTLDDVLESLLGLPPTSRSPSPGPISIISATASSPGRPGLSLPERQHQRRSCGDIQANVTGSASETVRSNHEGGGARRKSEGSNEVADVSSSSAHNLAEKIEMGDTPKKEVQSQMALIDTVVKCRYSKCGKTATVLEAKRTFKTCHNCSHIYCSRECRRAHWERHRRTCLHSRVGALCRQVLATAKEDTDTLHELSQLARRGYLTHGRGVVKTFFSSPEQAEKFVSRGFSEMGEPAFVRWSDLLPAEMGADLYAELIKLCKAYNPDTRFVLYVAVCVVSEVPTSGAVKWERQLVSRCCKIRLEKALVPPKSDAPPPLPPRHSSSDSLNITREMENPETLILTSLPGVAGQLPEQKVREICFTNIQRELRQRGVSLRRQFPDIYKKLCAYVEGGSERFTPVTIYPRDTVSGKTFMCIIMPDSEPEKLELLPKDSTRVQTVDVGIASKTT